MERDAGGELAAERRAAAPHQPHALVSHWDWRPEWAEERPCWFWYLTFDPGTIEQAVARDDLARVRATPWLDEVPDRWLHLTVCEVGYADELDESVVAEIRDRVSAVAAREGHLRLRLGPVRAMRSAVVLQADGGEQLRSLQRGAREATAQVLGRDALSLHPLRFWPHVSLGYANGPVPGELVSALLAAMRPVGATVRPTGLELVAVTRRSGHYQWGGPRQRSGVGLAAGTP